jgi:hypothetical protein
MTPALTSANDLRLPTGRNALTLIVAFLCVLVLSDSCYAQGLFGERSLGGSLSKRSRPGATSTSGATESKPRFVRDERSDGDLVGSNSSAEAASRFVGGQSTATAAVSSVTGLREEARPPLNRPRIIRPTGLYPERLTLSSDVLDIGSTSSNISPDTPRISESLQSFIQSRSLTIEVSQADHSAILRGAVPSEADRQQTELLVKFEPGIQKVVNELTVDSSLPPIPRRRRAPNSVRD